MPKRSRSHEVAKSTEVGQPEKNRDDRLEKENDTKISSDPTTTSSSSTTHFESLEDFLKSEDAKKDASLEKNNPTEAREDQSGMNFWSSLGMHPGQMRGLSSSGSH